MLNLNPDEFTAPISKFEAMLKTNEILFFDAQEFESIVRYYIDYGQTNLADRALEIGMKQHPQNAELILLKSELLIFEGNYKCSLRLLEIAEKLTPKHEEVYLQRATIASKSKQHFEAINFLKKALEFSDDQIEIWSLIGMEYLILEDFIPAKNYFKLCLNKDPLDYQSLYNLLYAFEQLNDSSGAIDVLNNVLEHDPYCEVAWHQLGKIYSNHKKYEEALSAYDFAIISDSSFTGAYIEKAKILEKLNKINSAIENYQIALNINDPSAYVYNRIANCYKILGSNQMAIKYLKKAISIEPTFEKGWIEIVDIFYSNKDFKAALEYAKKGIESNGDNLFLIIKSGEILFKIKRFHNAIYYFENAIQLNNSEIKIWDKLIDCNIILKRYNQAQSIINKALKLHPKATSIIFRKAVIEIKLGNTCDSKKYINSLDKTLIKKFWSNSLYSKLKDIF